MNMPHNNRASVIQTGTKRTQHNGEFYFPEELKDEGIANYPRLLLEDIIKLPKRTRDQIKARSGEILFATLVDTLARNHCKLTYDKTVLEQDKEKLKQSLEQLETETGIPLGNTQLNESSDQDIVYTQYLDKAQYMAFIGEQSEQQVETLPMQLPNCLSAHPGVEFLVQDAASVKINYTDRAFKASLSCEVPKFLFEQTMQRVSSSLEAAPPPQDCHPSSMELLFEALRYQYNSLNKRDWLPFMQLPLCNIGNEQNPAINISPWIHIVVANQAKSALIRQAKSGRGRRSNNIYNFNGFCVVLSQKLMEASQKLLKHNNRLKHQIAALEKQRQTLLNKSKPKISDNFNIQLSINAHQMLSASQQLDLVKGVTASSVNVVTPHAKFLSLVSKVIEQTIKPTYNPKIDQLKKQLQELEHNEQQVSDAICAVEKQRCQLDKQNNSLTEATNDLRGQLPIQKNKQKQAAERLEHLRLGGFEAGDFAVEEYMSQRTEIEQHRQALLQNQCQQLETQVVTKLQEGEYLASQIQAYRHALASSDDRENADFESDCDRYHSCAPY